MTTKTPLIIDTDPGIDDAVALAIALNHANLDVRLITTVSGNVDVTQTTENSLKLLSFMKKEVPVAKGCNQLLTIKQGACIREVSVQTEVRCIRRKDRHLVVGIVHEEGARCL